MRRAGRPQLRKWQPVDLKRQPVATEVLPSAPPSVPPGAIASIPLLSPFSGPTPFKFLYDELGGVEDRVTTLEGGGAGSAPDGWVPVFSVGSSSYHAQNWVQGPFGVGLTASPTYRFEVNESPTRVFIGATTNGVVGSRGIRLDKTDKTDATPHVIGFLVNGVIQWENGQDYDTNNASGRSDYVPVYCKSANAGAGADVFRFSHEADSSVSASVKAAMGRAVGTPRNQTEFLLVNGGDDVTALSGMTIRYWDGGNARNALNLTQRHATSKRTIINFNSQYLVGTDLNAVGAQNFWIYDNALPGVVLTFSPTGEMQVYKDLFHSGAKAGFMGAAATVRQTVTGSRGTGAALADLLTKLATKGLITDGTTA